MGKEAPEALTPRRIELWQNVFHSTRNFFLNRGNNGRAVS
jgi:hypothetical protein